MIKKKKLMAVVGAGASVELGMPSVKCIDELMCKWAREDFPLAYDSNQSLYSYIRDQINEYYSRHPKSGLRRETNFEEVLYVCLQLAAILEDNNYMHPTNAFLSVKRLPKIELFQEEKNTQGSDLKLLVSILKDKLGSEIRERCKLVKSCYKHKFDKFKKFVKQLYDSYDVACINLNYDNLFYQACPRVFTGFDSDGGFDIDSVYSRDTWRLIFHVHGSVHFDMPKKDANKPPEIRWNSDLELVNNANSFGRSSQYTLEGMWFPTSTIIAGYGKPYIITQRAPFSTYYSRIGQIAHEADAFLFLGYGFGDYHLNSYIQNIRQEKRKKPAVVIDFASDCEEPMEIRGDRWKTDLCETLHVNGSDMGARRRSGLLPIANLKSNCEFEIFKNSNCDPLSVWYGGFLKACEYYSKIESELESVT